MAGKDLGLKCGIEIHQQLQGQKLFCNCPTELRDDEPHFKIQRKIRAVAGEKGEIDIAALQEQLKNKTFVYQGYNNSTCLVETDSEPPHEINQEALYTTLQFVKSVQAEVFPIIQVMRKTIANGSVTSGFQRTAIVAQGGKINTKAGVVRIESINLEEDAARQIHKTENKNETIFRLDRLGIPLIEVTSAPDIKSAEQCQETAKKLGLLLRSLPGVKRGLGTIRQDVNVSIKDGTRIEIKGAQDLKMLPTLVELEVKRQLELLKLKEELNQVKLNKFKIYDLTLLLEKSTSKIIVRSLGNKGKILALKLNNFHSLIGRELQPNYRLGTELSSRAKVKAGVGGIFHSDELPNYGITNKEVEKIKKELKCTKKDAFVLVADNEDKSILALEAVYERIKECFMGIPKEVRKAHDDGTTRYLRPIPGSARMYPETDVPLIKPNLKKVELPELLEEKFVRYQSELGLSKDLAEFIGKSDKMLIFEDIIKKYPKQKPAFIAETLTSNLLEIKRKYNLEPNLLKEKNFQELFKYLDEDKIHKDIILDVLIDMIKGKFKIENYASLSTENLHKIIKDIINKNQNAPMGALMGICMKELSGKASGKVISEMLKKILQKPHR